LERYQETVAVELADNIRLARGRAGPAMAESA